MVLGLIQFKLTAKHLGEAGLRPGHEHGLSGRERAALSGVVVVAALVVGLALAGVLHLDPVVLARGTTVFIVGVAVLYFVWVLAFVGLDRMERQRVGVIAILFVAAALFWAGFEQAGSSFNLFAERYTARSLPSGFTIPTGWFQTLGPIFIISLAPVMAAL